MALPIVYSIKAIEQQFNTGEEPVWDNFMECLKENIR